MTASEFRQLIVLTVILTAGSVLSGATAAYIRTRSYYREEAVKRGFADWDRSTDTFTWRNKDEYFPEAATGSLPGE